MPCQDDGHRRSVNTVIDRIENDLCRLYAPLIGVNRRPFLTNKKLGIPIGIRQRIDSLVSIFFKYTVLSHPNPALGYDQLCTQFRRYLSLAQQPSVWLAWPRSGPRRQVHHPAGPLAASLVELSPVQSAVPRSIIASRRPVADVRNGRPTKGRRTQRVWTRSAQQVQCWFDEDSSSSPRAGVVRERLGARP